MQLPDEQPIAKIFVNLNVRSSKLYRFESLQIAQLENFTCQKTQCSIDRFRSTKVTPSLFQAQFVAARCKIMFPMELMELMELDLELILR